MNKICKYFIIPLLTVFFCAASIFAGGGRTNLQGTGMARTFTAVARGIDAVGINPANLGYPDKRSISINILNFGIHTGSDFLNYPLYKKYFTGDENDSSIFLNDRDKKRILETFPDGLANTSFHFEMKLFSASYFHPEIGGFAFNISDQAGFNIQIPKDYARFLLYGNPLGSRFDFSDTYFNALWLREYSISYGRRTPRFVFMKSMSAGISVKLIHGFGIADLSRNKTFFETDENALIHGVVDYRAKAAGVDFIVNDTTGEFSLFPKPAGTGYGFDIGVSGYINKELSVGIALVDIGAISWKHNTREIRGYSELTIDDPVSSNRQIDTLENIFKKKYEPVPDFSTPLPAMLRIGFAYQLDKAPFITSFPGELLLAFDYNQGFNKIGGNTTTPRFSLGAEYKPWKWFPIRTGLSVGGTDRVNMGFGLGFLLGVVDIEFATENFGAVLTPNDFRRVSFAFGIKVRI